MDLVDASGVAARDRGQRGQTGSKHVRLSIAWSSAVAPINNGSPNCELALTYYCRLSQFN
jgi:hypothetical protein